MMSNPLVNAIGHRFRYSRKKGRISPPFGHLFRYFTLKAAIEAGTKEIAERVSVTIGKIA